MTSNGSTSGLAAVAASSSSFTVGEDGYIRLASTSTVLPLTVHSKSGSTFVFSDGGSRYLGYTSSSGPGQSSRYLSLGTSSSNWTLSFSNGSASMTAARSSGGGGGSNNTYYFRYSSNYFNISTSSSTFAIYKKITIDSTEEKEVDLTGVSILNYDGFGAYLESQNLIYSETTDQLSREYGTDGTLTFSIVAPEEDQAVEISGIKSDARLGDSFSIGVRFISGITTVVDKTYPVYVVKEEGHKLWLTDAEGNGFIVKR